MPSALKRILIVALLLLMNIKGGAAAEACRERRAGIRWLFTPAV
jgi:hypothetical protein